MAFWEARKGKVIHMWYEQYLWPVVTAAVVILITWVVSYLFNLVFVGWYRIGVSLVRLHVQRIATIVIWSVGLIIAVEQLGLRVDLLLLLIGILGIGTIIAATDVLRNLAAKYFSDVYIPFKTGDTIRISGHSGKVIEINPVSTVLLTEKEELVSIPNSLFIKEPTVNITPQAWKEITVPIAIGGQVDLPAFESRLIKAINKFKLHLDERFPPILTLKRREKNFYELVLTLMIKDPSRKDEITTEINRKIAELTEQMKRKEKKKSA